MNSQQNDVNNYSSGEENRNRLNYDDSYQQRTDEIRRNLSPNVIRLDKDESRELDYIHEVKSRPSNKKFLKSLKNIKSKVGCFQDNHMKNVSLKAHILNSEGVTRSGITESME